MKIYRIVFSKINHYYIAIEICTTKFMKIRLVIVNTNNHSCICTLYLTTCSNINFLSRPHGILGEDFYL